MLQSLIFAFVLAIVSPVAVLGTQIALSAQSAPMASPKADRLVSLQCQASTWPDIPESCLQNAKQRALRIIQLKA